jgi:hypothetical protein
MSSGAMIIGSRDRGPRQMPSLYAIARYWHDRGEPFDVDLANPHCFGCRRHIPVQSDACPDLADPISAIDVMLEALAVGRHPRYARRIAVFEESAKSVRRELARAREVWERERWQQSSSYLERAHLITRVFDGLDGPQNLAPLCGSCHRYQPSFEPGQEQEALDWVVAGGPDWIGIFKQEMAAQALTGVGRS